MGKSKGGENPISAEKLGQPVKNQVFDHFGVPSNSLGLQLIARLVRFIYISQARMPEFQYFDGLHDHTSV